MTASSTTTPEKNNNYYDAILIGSGMGSLTTAAFLAKLKKMRVLVLEQHFVIGGQTHSFHRKGKYEFDVGLHYVGLMDGSPEKSILDFITSNQVKWQKMPDDFEVFSYPGFDFKVPSNKAAYQARLIERFPNEEKAIRQYFKDVKTAGTWFTTALFEDIMPRFLSRLLRKFYPRLGRLSTMTSGEYMDRNFKDSNLKAILLSQWGDYGVIPRQSAFGMHSLIVSHFWRGAWYPVGGAKTIAQAIVPTIEKHGGLVLKRQTVSEILIQNGKAYGVRAHSSLHPEQPGQEFYAPLIISGAGSANTYLNLIPKHVDIPFRENLAKVRGLSAFCVYLGLKESPAKFGIKGENHWIFEGTDHDAAIDKTGTLRGVYLSFPSLKDPAAKSHTADIITLMDYERFAEWRDGKWKKRGTDYEALKAEVARDLIAQVEKKFPGFGANVEFMDTSSPLTMEHFLKTGHGLFYGIPVTPDRLFTPWTRSKTPIENLYLTGADVVGPGIVGAMMGGVKTAGVVLLSHLFTRRVQSPKKSLKNDSLNPKIEHAQL